MSRPIVRGDVYWVDLPSDHTVGAEQRTSSNSPRPWVVVSAPAVHCRLPLVIGVPLSTKTHKAAQLSGCRVVVPLDQFIQEANQQTPINADMVALAEQVRALSTERLIGDPVARLTIDKMNEIDARLAFALKLP